MSLNTSLLKTCQGAEPKGFYFSFLKKEKKKEICSFTLFVVAV